MNLRALRVLKREAKSTFTFVFPPALSPARCGRLLALTNPSLEHTLTQMHRCTWHYAVRP